MPTGLYAELTYGDGSFARRSGFVWLSAYRVEAAFARLDRWRGCLVASEEIEAAEWIEVACLSRASLGPRVKST